MSRTQSAKAEKAERLLAKYPDITGADLARKTGLNITTIYRSAWYKAHRAAQKAAQQ